MAQFKAPLTEEQFKSLKDGDELIGVDGSVYEMVSPHFIGYRSGVSMVLSRHYGLGIDIYKFFRGKIISNFGEIEENLN